jgi:hypothetical protein
VSALFITNTSLSLFSKNARTEITGPLPFAVVSDITAGKETGFINILVLLLLENYNKQKNIIHKIISCIYNLNIVILYPNTISVYIGNPASS